MNPFTRLVSGAAALALGLCPIVADAGDGLVVKLKDGSTAVNAPDVFAAALSRSWGDGSRFCAALKSLMATTTANGVVTSCTAQPYASNGVVMSGRTPLITFTGRVVLQGTSPINSKTCPFTDTLDVSLQAPLNVTSSNVTGLVKQVAFGTPTLHALLFSETWGAPCGPQAGSHPGGVSLMEIVDAPTAASDIGFPGAALADALAPYAGPTRAALNGMTFSVSAATGDVVYTVGNSLVYQRLHEAPTHVTPAP